MCLFTNNCTPPLQLFALSPPSRLHPTPPHIPIPSPMTPTKIAPAGNMPESAGNMPIPAAAMPESTAISSATIPFSPEPEPIPPEPQAHPARAPSHLVRAQAYPVRVHSKVGFVARNSDCQACNNDCKPRNHYFPPRIQNKHHLHPCRKGLSLCCMGGDGDEGNGCGTDLFIGNAIASSKVVSLPL